MERAGEAATEDWSGYDMGRWPGVGSRTRARAGLPGRPGQRSCRAGRGPR